MSAKPRSQPASSGLQVDQDLAFQQISWRVERIGWAVFLGVLIAAVLGAFGSGVFSRTTTGSPADGIWLEYERFTRLQSPTELIVHVTRSRAQGEKVQLIWGGDYVRDAEIQSLMPANSGSRSSPDGALLSFDLHDAPGDREFVFRIQFNRAGLIHGRIGLDGGPIVDTRQWVYP